MPIPETAAFDEALESVTLDPPSGGDWQSVVMISATPPGVPWNNTISYAERRLWSPPGMTMSLDALVKRVEKECEAARYPAFQGVATAILGIFSLIRQPGRPATNQLNDLFNHPIETDLSQWLILPGPSPLRQARRLGCFQIGALRHEQLEYRMRRAGCDYFDREAAGLIGCLAFERDPFAVRLLPVAEACSRRGAGEFEAFRPGYEVLDHYFRSVAEALFRGFFRAFDEEQVLRVAIGFGYSDVEQLRLLPGVKLVSLFSRVGAGRMGWGCPTVNIPAVDFGTLDEALRESAEFLEAFGVGRFAPSELSETLRTVARFRMKAAKLESNGDVSEAFLSHVIALDLLLGQKEEATKSVARRAAALVHRELGSRYGEQRRTIEKLYDIRSQFVHGGRAPESGVLGDVKAVSEEILYCLLRLNRSSENHGAGFVARWLRNLDVLVARLEAGQEVPPEDLALCGLAASAADRARPVFDFRRPEGPRSK